MASQSVYDVRSRSRINFFCNTSGDQISIDSVVGIQIIVTPINGFAEFTLDAPTRGTARTGR